MKFLKYKKNEFYVDNISADKLSKKFETPIYCYSLSQIKYNIKLFKDSFLKINPFIFF